MSYAVAVDGTRLYLEEAGEGTAIVFVHEFAGNHSAWEPQLNFFARRHRCVTFAARGYPPSDIPEDVAAYSQDVAVSDILAVMDHLRIDRAHVVGLSMGGFATLHLGLKAPERALSLTFAGVGYGAEKQHEDHFRSVSLEVARSFETLGARVFAETYASGASRVQLQNKDPRGWRALVDRLATHSERGAANTMRGVQARRPSLYDLEAEIAAMTVPALIVVGDEDDHCLQPGLFLKKTLPAAGLAILPKTGHTLNLEEPELFNSLLREFIAMVEARRWLPRDPRARSGEVMKTS
jgi:pimeloyl-ACP methyl ester carboxylesterase